MKWGNGWEEKERCVLTAVLLVSVENKESQGRSEKLWHCLVVWTGPESGHLCLLWPETKEKRTGWILWDKCAFLPVYSKILKAEDVQQSDGASESFGLWGWRLVNGCIDLLHDPHKQTPVNTLRTYTQAETSFRKKSLLEVLSSAESLLVCLCLYVPCTSLMMAPQYSSDPRGENTQQCATEAVKTGFIWWAD